MKNIDHPVPVYLFGGEGTGWALDSDVATTKQSLSELSGQVTLTSLEKAEVIHSVWEYPLLHLDPSVLHGKRIVCHICNDLIRTFEDPAMVAAGGKPLLISSSICAHICPCSSSRRREIVCCSGIACGCDK